MWSESELASEIERSFDLAEALRSYRRLPIRSEQVYRRSSEPDPSGRMRMMWEFVWHEVYTLLCTDDSKYDKERKLLEKEAKPVVVALAAVIGSKFGVWATAATSMAALGLTIPLRIGVNAWCAYYKSGELDGPEKAAVKELADKLVGDDR